MTSMTRIAKATKIILSILPYADVLHSALYALVAIVSIISVEVVGRRRDFRDPARVAVSDCGADATLAIRLCMDCPGPAALGARLDPALRLQASTAPSILDRIFLRRALVFGELLLDSRYDAPLWRHAAVCADAASRRL